MSPQPTERLPIWRPGRPTHVYARDREAREARSGRLSRVCRRHARVAQCHVGRMSQIEQIGSPAMQLPHRHIAPFAKALARGVGNSFATSAPSAQTAVDAINSAWASRLPLAGVTSGHADLFTDVRVDWAIEQLGGVNGAECIELGPLEGGHSYMLQKAGAARVTAVEANMDAFLKCLIVKEIFELDSCRFLCGDAVEYLQTVEHRYDVCWCAGFLYHMVDPVQLIKLISERTSRLYIWTHYYDAAKLAVDEPKGKPFKNRVVTGSVCDGYRHQLYRHEYGNATRLLGFWGGTQPFSNWLTLPDLLEALEHFGWSDVRTQIVEDHPHGPCVNLTAIRA